MPPHADYDVQEGVAAGLNRLQSAAAALSQAVTPEQVADAIVVLGTGTCFVAILSDDGTEFIILGSQGRTRFPTTSPLPVADAVRHGQPVFLASAEERHTRYPALAEFSPFEADGALLALPLVVNERAIGGVQWAFPAGRTFASEDWAFVRTLAELCGQNLERLRVTDRTALLAVIVESTDDAIVSKTLEGTITSWNPAAERLYGWSADEVRGKHVSLLVPPEQTEELPAIMERLRRGERVEHYETVRRRKDGSLVRVSVSISPVKDGQGRVIGASGIGRDITEQRRLEEDLRQRATQLADINRRQEEFLAMLAHELRNPLVPIRNAAQVMRLVDRHEQRLQWASEVLERQTQHLSRLVDDLLDVSRLQRGIVKLHLEPVELSVVLGQAVETVRPLVDAHQHDLTVLLPGEPLRLEGDVIRLVQVFANLLNNAAKFTPEGGHVWLTARCKNNQAVVSVKDNGVGMVPETLSCVFDLFAQGDDSLDRSQGGLGIGLTLVRGLVELHGGVVEAFSDGPQRGSEFVVRLPALRDRQTALNAEPRDAAAPIQRPISRRVLVVDDNRDVAESMAHLVQLWGHDVRQAHDGPQAIAIAAEYHPQVIVLDMGLPGLSGLEVANRLRQDQAFANTLIAMLTGYGQDEYRRRSREAGVDYYWVKPVEPNLLQRLLASAELVRPRAT